MQTVEEYLKDKTPAQRAEFKRIRDIVITHVPEAQETMSYGIPTFKYESKLLLHFGAFKEHMSVFPGPVIIEKLGDRLNGYKVSKGTIQYTENKVLPHDVIKEIIKLRLASIEDR